MPDHQQTTASAPIGQIAYMIAFSVGIARNDCGPDPMKYAIANVVLCALSIAFSCCACFLPLKALPLIALIGFAMEITGFVIFILGWIWFSDYTGGFNVVQYAREFGPNKWLEMPLVLQIMYFNMWLCLVMLCIAGVVLGIALVCSCCMGVTEVWSYVPVFGARIKTWTSSKNKKAVELEIVTSN
ncbi:hypothetical protein BDR26DRAFT_852654 [Obelidium mucronatum]|nr:hypothetical protein BDR26DRAFT_852654 [Obelidium mucronatum]